MVKMRLLICHFVHVMLLQNVTGFGKPWFDAYLVSRVCQAHIQYWIGHEFDRVWVKGWLQEMVKMRLQIYHFVHVMLLQNVAGFGKPWLHAYLSNNACQDHIQYSMGWISWGLGEGVVAGDGENAFANSGNFVHVNVIAERYRLWQARVRCLFSHRVCQAHI